MSARRYVILGAGAVGSALGGMLALAGARVVLIAPGAQPAALRPGGLRLDTPSRSLALRVEVAGSPRELGCGAEDVVLLCTKSQHTGAALADLAACAPRGLPIVCAQNGVANEPLAALR